ncbi:MAG: hypothetical protein WDW36_005868 [Sanguina aurantia]
MYHPEKLPFLQTREQLATLCRSGLLTSLPGPARTALVAAVMVDVTEQHDPWSCLPQRLRHRPTYWTEVDSSLHQAVGILFQAQSRQVGRRGVPPLPPSPQAPGGRVASRAAQQHLFALTPTGRPATAGSIPAVSRGLSRARRSGAHDRWRHRQELVVGSCVRESSGVAMALPNYQFRLGGAARQRLHRRGVARLISLVGAVGSIALLSLVKHNRQTRHSSLAGYANLLSMLSIPGAMLVGHCIALLAAAVA